MAGMQEYDGDKTIQNLDTRSQIISLRKGGCLTPSPWPFPEQTCVPVLELSHTPTSTARAVILLVLYWQSRLSHIRDGVCNSEMTSSKRKEPRKHDYGVEATVGTQA